MKASEGRVGRVFVIRLEHGDIIPDCIEKFAEAKKISVGQVIMIGGIGEGQVVVGPLYSNLRNVIPAEAGIQIKSLDSGSSPE